MKRLSSIAILIIIMTFFVGQALGNTLDTSGTAAEKEFQLINIKLVKAGKKPHFEIQLKATAIIHSPNMPGWPDKTYLVTAFGGYNYDNGAATESIYAGIIGPGSKYNSERLFLYQGVCNENPWIHGNSSCYTVNAENSMESIPGFAINYPTVYPMSANYVPNHLHDSLVNWENTYPPEDLSDWNPYAGSESSNDLEIESPSAYQVIPENAANFQIAVKSNISPAPQTLEMRWERLDDVGGWQGDIKLPEGSKMWQPIQGPNSASWGNFPLTIPAFSSSESELYRVSVRGAGQAKWSSWRSFWIGKPVINIDKVKEMVELGSKTQQKVHSAMFKNFLEKKKEVSKDEFKIPQTLTQAMRTDLMPTKLYIKVTNGKCELWLKIKNLGQYWFRKKLEWEVYRNGSHAGTWGTDHKRDIGPGAEMDIRLAYPAALPISLFGMNNWRVKLIPEGGDQNENNNEIGPVSLRCKKPPSELKSLKRKETIQGLDKDVIKPVLLLPAVKMRPLSSDNPIALKFRHDVRQKGFKYEFEKWDVKRKRWVKTSEPRMIRSQTSKGTGMGMTTSYFRFKTPGKYRWGTAGLSPQKRQEIVVGDAVAKQVAKVSPKQVSDKGKSPKLQPPSRKEKSLAKAPQSIHQIKKPSIWFDLGTKPAPTPKLNKAFNLVIGVKNIGYAKNGNSPSNKAVVKLTCQALNGGNCEKLLGDSVVPSIEPGKMKTLNLRSVFKATKGGKYRVSMVLDPVPQTPANVKIRMSNLRKSYSFDFNVIEYTFPKNEAIKKQPKKIQKRVPSKVMKNE